MPTFRDRMTVRQYVRRREDYQDIRKRLMNSLGLKADGKTHQDVVLREFNPEDAEFFEQAAKNACEYEAKAEKGLLKALQCFPVYTQFLVGVKGIGPIAAGWIIAEFDIEKAITVSKMWQFAGLNPGMVQGIKRVDDGKGKFHYEHTNTLVRGDKLTPGFAAPFNQKLRTALVGVMADGFIKQQNDYALNFYYPYKNRLEQEENRIEGEEKAWSEVSKGRRDRAAKRYMVKMFLKDLYVAWRTLEGLPIRKPYDEDYLGRKHVG